MATSQDSEDGSIFILRLLDLLKGPVDGLVVVCCIETEIAQALGAASTKIFLSKETAIKQSHQHNDVRAFHYEKLPMMIKQGLVIRESNKGSCSINICYEHGQNQRFKINVKCTKKKELYITSIHRTKPGQTRSLLRRGQKLRNHR